VPPHVVHAVRNGVEDPGPPRDRDRVRAAIGVPSDAPLVVAMGRLTPQKGFDVLLAAAGMVRERMPDARFVIVGSGPLEATLADAIASGGLDPAVQLVGRWPDAPSLLAAADVVALPSRFEGLPLVALEAMAVARPVVGTRVCGIDEVVVDEVTGRLVEPDSPETLARALLEVLCEPRLGASWGRAGRERFVASFTAPRMVDETQAVYAELLQPARALVGQLSAAR
jgi:glycosyltransferase involved in cell wall biosynthesis